MHAVECARHYAERKRDAGIVLELLDYRCLQLVSAVRGLDDNFRVDEEIVRRDHVFLEDDALEALFRYVIA